MRNDPLSIFELILYDDYKVALFVSATRIGSTAFVLKTIQCLSKIASAIMIAKNNVIKNFEIPHRKTWFVDRIFF